MKHLKKIVLLSIIASLFSFIQAQELIRFSDPELLVSDFFPHDSAWIITTQNKRAFYYEAKDKKDLTNLDGYTWKYTLSDSRFNGKVWFDNENVYFGNTNNTERVNRKNGTLIDELPFANIDNAPYSDGKHVYLIADYKGKRSQICYYLKRKKVVWAVPTSKDFSTPIYTQRFIITRDETGFPITLSYDKGKPMLPEKYEGGCPFNSWVDMFNMNNNDLSDSFFYYDGYVYAVNFYLGFLRKFEPNNYPIPLVSVDMNKFTKRESFSYAKIPSGSLFYSRQGIQFVSETELDSLNKTQRKGPMGTFQLSIPLSKPQYYKVKQTTLLGNFLDFETSNFIAFLENRYIVFEQNGQMIGVSPVGARTYNFPNLGYPIDKFSLFDDIIFYSSANTSALIKAKIERVFTEEEIKAMQPPQEILDMIQKMQEEQQNTNSQEGNDNK
ncbi:MAG: hypothetical protein J5I91_04805 [Bacteroidetes bacterium]|nr:hypothetical protein [Bacteroidota bacterium]